MSKAIAKIVVFLALLPAKNIMGQSREANCSVIRQGSPVIFIDREKGDSVADSRSGKYGNIVFSIHNNSTCNIVLNATTPKSIIADKVRGNMVSVLETRDLPENAPVEILFRLVQWPSRKHISQPAWSRGCIVYTRQLLSAKSTLIEIPRKYFKKGQEVGIAIEYQVNADMDSPHLKFDTYYQKLER